MRMQRCVRAQRHLHQVLTGADRACVHHRAIEVVDADLGAIENPAPLVHVAAQIHRDRQQPVAIRERRPFGQRNRLAEDARSGQPHDVIGVQEHRLRQLRQRERDAQRQIRIVDGLEGGIDEVEEFAEAEH